MSTCAAAVVLPSLFEEQLTLEAEEVRRLLEHGAGSLSAALALDDDNTGPSGYLALVEKAQRDPPDPVIASLNGVTPGTWVEHATLLEEAGADALELNVYYVSSSPGLAGSEVERRCLDLVRSVREAIGSPLGGQAQPYFSSVADLTRQLVQGWRRRPGAVQPLLPARPGPGDYRRFELRLEECLVALGRLLERPSFGTGPVTVGAELEWCWRSTDSTSS